MEPISSIPTQTSPQDAPEVVLRPLKKPWYKSPLKIFFRLLGILLLAGVLFFAWKVVYYASAIKKGDYSVFNGEIVDIRQLAEPGQVNRVQLESPDDPFFGIPDAKVVVVEFGDFGCPFCRQNFPTILKIREQYKDKIKFIFRDFPITAIHPQALIAAEASECAHEQGMFWPYHDLLYARQNQYSTKEDLIGYADELGLNTDRFASCLNNDSYQQENLADLQDGVALGVSGTPTFFFNGQKVAGVIGEDTFKEILDALLAKNK